MKRLWVLLLLLLAVASAGGVTLASDPAATRVAALPTATAGVASLPTARINAPPPSEAQGQVSPDEGFPSSPRAVAIDPTTGDLYVVGRGQVGQPGWLSIVRNGALAGTVRVGQEPQSVAVHPRTGYAYIVNHGSDHVSVAQGPRVMATIDVGHLPNAVAIHPDTGYVYVGNTWAEPGAYGEPGTVSIIRDTQVITHVPVGLAPQQIEIHPTNGLVYVRNRRGSITVMRDIQVVADVPVDMPWLLAAMALEPRTGCLYVACGASVLVMEGTEWLATLNLGGSPIEALAADGTTGYVYAAQQGTMTVIEDLGVLATLPVQGIPNNLACQPLTGYCYLTSLLGMGDTALTVIHGTEILTSMWAGTYPYALAADPQGGRMVLASDGLTLFAGPHIVAEVSPPTHTETPIRSTRRDARGHGSGLNSPSGLKRAGVPGSQIDAARSSAPANMDPGQKGLHVHPSELPAQVDIVGGTGTQWVRLEFKMKPDGSLDLARYDQIVDALQAYGDDGIAVLGLVNYSTIPEDLDGDGQPDYNDPEDYIAHQQRFTDTLAILAQYFKGTIGHWEIWNEENGGQWHISPEYYARLLVHSADIARRVDPANQIVFGGLDHTWVTSQYLEPVYDALDQDWGGARPFDILAVHPYFVYRQGQFILDPNVYLWEVGDPSQTALDKYLDYMASRGDADKDIWITEIGWNSALDNPAIEACPEIEPWCVTRAEQAQYLQDSFDILFKEVEDPQGRRDRVKTVIWYQYHDTASSVADMAAKLSINLDALQYDPQKICPADWGLVDGARQPKPSHGTFQAYRRIWAVYIPLVLRSQAATGVAHAPPPIALR